MTWTEQTMNVIRISITMMVLFTAVLSHEFIMEPLLHSFAHYGIGGIHDKDGYLALCIVYLFNAITCFFSSWFVAKFSGKWAMVVGMVTVLCFEVSYVFPDRFAILSISALLGVGTTLLWVGHGQYISENVTDKNREKNTSIQWAFFKMSLIFGGLSFFIYFQNSSIENVVESGQFQLILCIFMICTVLSLVNTCFIPQSKLSQERIPKPFLQTIESSWQLFKGPEMIHFSIFFFYTGLLKSFWISIFPACIKFTNTIAANPTSVLTLVMITTGCGQVLGSVLMTIVGDGIRRLGQQKIIIVVLLSQVALYLAIALVFPNDSPLGQTNESGPFFQPNGIIAMLISFSLGFGDAVLQTQIYSYIAKYYQKDSGTVFSIFRFSCGIASTTMFFAAQYFYLLHHLTLLVVCACVSCFAITKFHSNVEKRNPRYPETFMVSVVPRVGILTNASPLAPVRS